MPSPAGQSLSAHLFPSPHGVVHPQLMKAEDPEPTPAEHAAPRTWPYCWAHPWEVVEVTGTGLAEPLVYT